MWGKGGYKGFGQGLGVKLILQSRSDPKQGVIAPSNQKRGDSPSYEWGAQEDPETGGSVRGSIRGLMYLMECERKPILHK